jgi:hypothetical protein
MTIAEPPWKAENAERSGPLHKFRGVVLFRKIQTGLERGRVLSRKQRNNVYMQQLSNCHSNNQFSEQPLTAFEYRFNFRTDAIVTLQHP